MNRRVQRLGFSFGAILLVTFLWVRLFPADPAPIAPVSDSAGTSTPADVLEPASQGLPSTAPTDASPSPSETPQVFVPGSSVLTNPEMRTYAVSTFELAGLPPDASPGMTMELWAAWEPPIVETPQFQRILREVTLEKIVPGLTPESPATALLQVRAKDLPDLLYADRFGDLTVAIVR